MNVDNILKHAQETIVKHNSMGNLIDMVNSPVSTVESIIKSDVAGFTQVDAACVDFVADKSNISVFKVNLDVTYMIATKNVQFYVEFWAVDSVISSSYYLGKLNNLTEYVLENVITDCIMEARKRALSVGDELYRIDHYAYY